MTAGDLLCLVSFLILSSVFEFRLSLLSCGHIRSEVHSEDENPPIWPWRMLLAHSSN